MVQEFANTFCGVVFQICLGILNNCFAISPTVPHRLYVGWILYRVLALRGILACGAANNGSTGRQHYIAPYGAFSFQNGFLENRDSKWKIEENNFHLSCNFLSNGYNFIFLAWKRKETLYYLLAFRRTPACGAVNNGSTGKQRYIAPYGAFSFRNGFLENRDSKWKIEKRYFHLSCNFLSNGYNFIFLAWEKEKHCTIWWKILKNE